MKDKKTEEEKKIEKAKKRKERELNWLWKNQPGKRRGRPVW